MRKTILLLYVAVIVAMAVATIVEKYQGSEYVAKMWYGSWWFSALWALLAATALVYFLRCRVRRLGTVVLHLSFLVILAGALLTHLTSRQGIVHLRQGETVSTYVERDGETMRVKPLPFTLRLDTFNIIYHAGTQAPADYQSRFTVTDKEGSSAGEVSMNNIYSSHGVRLYQSSYDPDLHGSYLQISSDPWGIPVTYTGYALLFIGLVWTIRRPTSGPSQLKGRWVTSTVVVSSILLAGGILYGCLYFSKADNAPLLISYNDRICPIETYALDLTKKLTGKRSYKDTDGRRYSAPEVMWGYVFHPDEWNQKPLIRVKSGALRERLQLPEQCSVNTFFNDKMGGYILGPYMQEYWQGQRDAFHKEVAKMDDRLQLIMELRQGRPLKLFPAQSFTSHPSPLTSHLSPLTSHHSPLTSIQWYSPTDQIPATVDSAQAAYIRDIFPLLNQYEQAGQKDVVSEILVKMGRYQQRYGGKSLPSAVRLRAEHIYNMVPFATILFMFCLTMGFICMGFNIYGGVRHSTRAYTRYAPTVGSGIMALAFAALTVCLGLRWIVSGTVPMGNGYETMLLMAWLMMLLTLCLWQRYPIMLTFGFLLSGFFLLVSHISQMDPQIGHLMPVLRSPLLTVHVSIIMMAYALLSLTFICAVAYVVSGFKVSGYKVSGYKVSGYKVSGRTSKPETSKPDSAATLLHLSRLFLYPAVACLCYGIFIGAIWANVSWGTYWSWDPKETWALISLMVYAVPLHQRSLPWLRRERNYHLYMLLAFLTLLMTYFGVNYFLGGMHSYA